MLRADLKKRSETQPKQLSVLGEQEYKIIIIKYPFIKSALSLLWSNSSLKYFCRMWRQDQQGLLTKPFGKSTFTRSSRGRLFTNPTKLLSGKIHLWLLSTKYLVWRNIFYVSTYKDWKLFLTETYNRNCVLHYDNSEKRKFCIFFFHSYNIFREFHKKDQSRKLIFTSISDSICM